MAFYHVLLSFRDDPITVRCVLADLSEKELKTRFLVSYRKGQSFLSDNEVIETATISKVTIIRTHDTMDRELANIQARSLQDNEEFNRNSPVFIFDLRGNAREHIVEAGEDVTASHVQRPPGSQGWLSTAVNNPWTTAIITIIPSLATAGLIFWLGWN